MLSTSREFLGLRSDLINGPTQPHHVDDNIPVCAGKRPVTYAESGSLRHRIEFHEISVWSIKVL